jgi:hypothetical protein
MKQLIFVFSFLISSQSFAQAPYFESELKKDYEGATEPAQLSDFVGGVTCSFFGAKYSKWYEVKIEVYTHKEIVGAVRGSGPRFPDYPGEVKNEITGLVERGEEYNAHFVSSGESSTKIEGNDLVWEMKPTIYARTKFTQYFRRSGPYLTFKKVFQAPKETYYGYCWREKNQ